MSDQSFYIFREGRRKVAGERLLANLRASLGRAADENGWTDALLRAGELECALADAGSASADVVAGVVGVCADAVVRRDFRRRGMLARSLPEEVPAELQVSTPEGFAYYALDPLAYAEAVEKIGFRRQVSGLRKTGSVVVVGIRSIGTSLSAVMAAEWQRRGVPAERFTVRPEGHPFERVVRWNAEQRGKIAGAAPDAMFVIVDEGPGLSGSSFLSVAEALVAAGVREEQIVLVPGHAPDLSGLCARDAARRWARYRCVAVEGGRHPEGEWIGGGQWRAKFCGDESEWPAAWTTMESPKFLSKDRNVIWKFAGLGPYGERAREQAAALADAGFGTKIVGGEFGYLGQEFVHGQALRKGDSNLERLRRMAEYCAFRAEKFECEVSAAQHEDFTTMVRVNFERGLDEPLMESWAKLEVARPTCCDGKMAPHEWMERDGKMMKLDATEHGDNHFFPGPCDVAWDLAGAIVEWGMDAFQRGAFLRMYREMSGDDAGARVRNYLLAYAVFHHGWSREAARGMRGTAEEERFVRATRKYRAWMERMVHSEARCTGVGENAVRRAALPARTGSD
ncbi:MAG TPA: hypothetical protein VGL89_03060 [Candidatus Koribacter sp.]|jgi:hypothetical protein